MSFTDSDIKNLKDRANKKCIGTPRCVVLTSEINALLVRLKAAEAVITTGHYCHVEPTNTCEGCKAVKAWRKAAGK